MNGKNIANTPRSHGQTMEPTQAKKITYLDQFSRGFNRMKKKNQRKFLNLKVKHRLQIWLIVRIGGIIGLTSIASVLILYGYAHHETVNSFYDAHIKIRRLSELLIPVVLAGGAISIIGGSLLAIFLPQKIAGPLYHIEKVMLQIEQGDLSKRIKLRTKDTLHSFSHQINRAIADIDSNVSHAKNLCAQLNAQNKGLTDEQQILLQQLEHHLSRFTTSAPNQK